MCICVFVYTRVISTIQVFLLLWAYYYSSVAFSETRELNKISTEQLPGYFREIVYIFHIDIQVCFQIPNYCDFFCNIP